MLIIGSHVSFKKDTQLLGSLEEALSLESFSEKSAFWEPDKEFCSLSFLLWEKGERQP